MLLLFPANGDQMFVTILNMHGQLPFPPGVVGRFVKLEPMAWSKHIR